MSKNKEYIDICQPCIVIMVFIITLSVLYGAYQLGKEDGVHLGKRIERCNTGTLDELSCRFLGLSYKGLSYN